MPNVEIIKAEKQTLNRINPISTKLRVAAYARVSTDSEDQLNSYNSQVQYYKDLISSNKDWEFVNIYADPGITGTQITNRIEFKKMIDDALSGKIDLIITKSISRFARNTVDTLHFVRKLKEKSVAVKFEEENINTLTMDGELLLTILSSVAQQEVQNISANVKKGLKIKMERGELVGFNKVLGYNYIPKDKKIVVNIEEAQVVKEIFNMYLEGYGCKHISDTLKKKGYKNKNGEVFWTESGIYYILKNEKYVGDVMSGKTFTVDPISKKRLENNGESDRYYIKDHHEAIISREDFEEVQRIANERSNPRRRKEGYLKTKNPFSYISRCGFCGSSLTRRTQMKYSDREIKIYSCLRKAKEGKKECIDSAAINEKLLEAAFIQAFNILVDNENDCINEFIDVVKQTFNTIDPSSFEKMEKDLKTLELKRDNLLEMYLTNNINESDYKTKYEEINKHIDKKKDELNKNITFKQLNNDINKRMNDFKEYLKEHKRLSEFDKEIFNQIVSRINVGGYLENGTKDPYLIEIVFNFGNKKITNNVDELKYIKVGSFNTIFNYHYFKIDDDGSRTRILKRSAKTIISLTCD